MTGIKHFNLTDEDIFAVKVAMNVARRFLQYPKIMPRQIIGLGNALYALECLPISTPGAFVEFGVVLRGGSEDFEEMQYIEFRITGSTFEIAQGGSVNIGAGFDSFSEPGWHIETNGFRNCELSEHELYSLEDTIADCLGFCVDDESFEKQYRGPFFPPCAKITVYDESDIEFK